MRKHYQENSRGVIRHYWLFETETKPLVGENPTIVWRPKKKREYQGSDGHGNQWNSNQSIQ